jgi:uncharacterized membrane protein YfcA
VKIDILKVPLIRPLGKDGIRAGKNSAGLWSASAPDFAPVQEWQVILLASLGVLFIGLAKAGFGGGLGMLITPLCVLAFGAAGKPPAFAIGMVLPLLCAGDLFTMYHYWGKWESRNLWVLLPGVVVGIILGAYLVNHLSPRHLNLCIGLVAVAFVSFQVVRDKFFKMSEAFKPNKRIGLPCGMAAGVTSTIAHGAGPVVTIFLLAQRLPKEVFVGTNVLIFTWINWLKVPFFVGNHIITRDTLLMSAKYFALVPVGVWLGVYLNRRVSEAFFVKVIYLLTFLAGLQLIFDVDLVRLWK